MQKVTSSSENVALNTTAAEVKTRFQTCQYSWDKVTNPVGNNIISRVAHAALEVVKNLAKLVYNAAVWLPNKIHSLLYPNAAAQTNANDDEIYIEQDSVVVSQYDSQDQVDAEGDIAPAVIEIEEQLAEPKAARSRTLLKAAAVGTVLAGATVGGLILANRYQVPYFSVNVPYTANVDTFFTATIPTQLGQARDAIQQNWNSFWMAKCDQPTIDGFKQRSSYTSCTTDAVCQAAELAKLAAAANCKV